MSVIFGRLEDAYEMLCAVMHCIGSERISQSMGAESLTPWSEVQSANPLTEGTFHLKVYSHQSKGVHLNMDYLFPFS